MATDTQTMAELKQLLIMGSDNPAATGNHLVRYLVDWYQRCERNHHQNQGPALLGSATGAGLPHPCRTLLKSTDVIPRLASEGQADTIIDTLRSYSRLPHVDMETVVLCLAVASKQGDHKKLVTDSHSAVREICTNTHLFFLFIQISKMIAKYNGHSGWGRGLRRAVNEWYLSWDPKSLALEVTRHSSAHGWTHRDVIRLAHLKLKEMPLGTQVVLHYVFMGLEKTRQEYTGKENTAQLLDLMAILDKDGHPQAQDDEKAWNIDEVINKVNKLHETYGSVTLDDVPSQCLKSPEVWSHLLDKLEAESAVASVNRLAKANLLPATPEASNALPGLLVDRLRHPDITSSTVTPATTLMALHAYQHPSRYSGEASLTKVVEKRGMSKGGVVRSPRPVAKAPPKKSSKINQQVVDALLALVTASAKNMPRPSGKLAVCVDVHDYMNTSHVWAGNPEGKGEVSAYEAAAVTVLSLTSGGTNGDISTLAFSDDGLVPLEFSEDTTLTEIIDTFTQTSAGDVDVEKAVKWGHENGADTVVLLTVRVDEKILSAATTALQQIKDDGKNMRLVLCGLATKYVDAKRTENFLLIVGFEQRTPAIITAFHNKIF